MARPTRRVWCDRWLDPNSKKGRPVRNLCRTEFSKAAYFQMISFGIRSAGCLTGRPLMTPISKPCAPIFGKFSIASRRRKRLTMPETDRRHWLRVFALVFSRDAFLPTPSDPRTFHQRAIDEGRFYEERVAENLSNLVFGTVFPELAKAIAAAAPTAPLQEVREAALILLYRLLFILYAEDRNLLPVREHRYDEYGLRERVRGDKALSNRWMARIEQAKPFRDQGRPVRFFLGSFVCGGGSAGFRQAQVCEPGSHWGSRVRTPVQIVRIRANTDF